MKDTHGHPVQPARIPRSRPLRQLHPRRRQARHLHRHGQQARFPSGKAGLRQTAATQQPQPAPHRSRRTIPPLLRPSPRNTRHRRRTRRRRCGYPAGPSQNYHAHVVRQPRVQRPAGRIPPPPPAGFPRPDTRQPQGRPGGRRHRPRPTRQHRRSAAQPDCAPALAHPLFSRRIARPPCRARHPRHAAGGRAARLRAAQLCGHGQRTHHARRRQLHPRPRRPRARRQHPDGAPDGARRLRHRLPARMDGTPRF